MGGYPFAVGLSHSLHLIGLTALSIVMIIRVVGLILVIALLTLPAATAGHWMKRLGWMMVLATGLSMFLTTIPRVAVYGSGVSPESAIVLTAGAVYLGSVLIRRFRSA